MRANEKSELTLKWGTLKGWSNASDECIAILKEYHTEPVSWGAAQQSDTPKQKELILKMIDAFDLIYQRIYFKLRKEMNELPTSAMGTLRLMPSTASQIGQFSKQLIQGVQEGNIHPIELLVILRALEGVSETVREAIKENIQNAADKYNEKSFEVFGARVEKSEVGVSYDYASTSDPDWQQFNVDEQTAATRRKEREQFLRSLKEPIDILDRTTGELITIRPPLKRSKSGIKVFLK